MGLPCGHGHNFHPSCPLHRVAALVVRVRDLRICLDYGKSHLNEQLPTPATVAVSCAIQGQHSSPAGEGRAMVLACVLRSTVVPNLDILTVGLLYPPVEELLRHCGHCKTPTSSLCLLFVDIFMMSLNSLATFPRQASWGAFVTTFRTHFGATRVQLVHVILNLQGNPFYIPPHIQKYFVNLHPGWCYTLGQRGFDAESTLGHGNISPPYQERHLQPAEGSSPTLISVL